MARSIGSRVDEQPSIVLDSNVVLDQAVLPRRPLRGARRCGQRASSVPRL